MAPDTHITHLHLSQDLTISNKFTISVPGETKYYFGECELDGRLESEIGCGWYALTEKAQNLWTGKTKVKDGIVLGLTYFKEHS